MYYLEVTSEDERNIQLIGIHSIGSDETFHRLVNLLSLTIALLRNPLYLCYRIVILHQRMLHENHWIWTFRNQGFRPWFRFLEERIGNSRSPGQA